MKPIINMRVVDWWSSDTPENFYANVFVQILSRKYEVRYSENPDFLLYGPFGFKHLQYECVRIFLPERISAQIGMSQTMALTLIIWILAIGICVCH